MDYDKFQHRQLRRNNKQLKLQLIILHTHLVPHICPWTSFIFNFESVVFRLHHVQPTESVK